MRIQNQERKDILLHWRDPASRGAHKQAFFRSGTQFDGHLAQLMSSMAQRDLPTQLVDQVRDRHRQLEGSYRQALKRYDGDPADVRQVASGLAKGMERAPDRKLEQLIAFVERQSAQCKAEIAAANSLAYHTSSRWLLAVFVIAMLVVAGGWRGFCTALRR